VGGGGDEGGGQPLRGPRRVVVDDAVGHPIRTDRNLAHPAPGAELDAVADRDRPLGDVGAGLRALRTAQETRPRIDAPGAALVVLARDRAVRRPPVPAEPVEAARERLAELAERARRAWEILRRDRAAWRAGRRARGTPPV